MALKILLGLAGHTVATAANAAEALAECDGKLPACFFVDLLMPEIDGEELIGRLSARPGPTPKIVVVTGIRDVSRNAAALKAGASLVLKKPVTLEQLVAALP